jgi:D-amino-acid dehydrogenase
MIVPSHFVPLAAPGMVQLGLKWMLNPESPFYIRPRLDRELFSWGWKFWRASNAEHVRRSAPLLRDLNFASRTLFEEFAGALAADEAPSVSPAVPGPTGDRRGIGEFGLVRRGLLMLCKTPHALEEEARFAAQANQLGVPATVLDATQVAELDPGVTMDVAGAVHFPKDAHFTPERYVGALQSACENLGVVFVWGAEAGRLQADRNRLTAVKAGAAEFEFDELVLCGGSWSPLLVRELGLRLPMQAGKGYSLTLTQPRELPRLCSIFTEARLAITPMGSSLRFGGTMELAGLTEKINPVRVQGILKSVPKYFPKFSAADFAGIEPWCGLRPCSPDGLPYLGRTAKYSNLIVATGHAMMGMSLSPITGKIVGELVDGEKPFFELSLLSPDRFA